MANLKALGKVSREIRKDRKKNSYVFSIINGKKETGVDRRRESPSNWKIKSLNKGNLSPRQTQTLKKPLTLIK